MFTSPTFTGTPLSTTPSANDNSTKIATTAYVQTDTVCLVNKKKKTRYGGPERGCPGNAPLYNWFLLFRSIYLEKFTKTLAHYLVTVLGK